jgi:hypothetical protein
MLWTPTPLVLLFVRMRLAMTMLLSFAVYAPGPALVFTLDTWNQGYEFSRRFVQTIRPFFMHISLPRSLKFCIYTLRGDPHNR